MMRSGIFVCALMLCLAMSMAGVGNAQSEPRFFSALQDVPLMPGLYEMSEMTVTFDKPEGRIIESVASIDSISREQVVNFYAQALPQLGWTAENENNFIRQGEHLSLGFESLDGRDVLRVMIRPGD